MRIECQAVACYPRVKVAPDHGLGEHFIPVRDRVSISSINYAQTIATTAPTSMPLKASAPDLAPDRFVAAMICGPHTV